MKNLPYIIVLVALLSCHKDQTPVPEIASEARGNKHVKAMQAKTQFGSLVKGYAFEDGMISRIDYMDNGFNVTYNKTERKITLSSYSFPSDYIIYEFGKEGRLKRMFQHLGDIITTEELYAYRGFLMNRISYPAETSGYIFMDTHSDYLSPWLQRLITSRYLQGSTNAYKRDTVYIRQTGAFELTTLNSSMQKIVVQQFSANIKDPEFNIPYTPSFERIDQCIAPENINRGWGMYNQTKFLGRLMLKSTRYNNGAPYPEMWLEDIVTDGDGMPISYKEWFTERFLDGWSYSKAIPTTYAYTNLY